MTEFTKDDIEHYRKQYALWTSRRQTTPEELHLIGRLRDALDEIEHLQARVQELEKERRWIYQDKTMIVKKDGDSWCAVLPDFKDLQQSESRWFSGDINKYMDDVYWYLNDEY